MLLHLRKGGVEGVHFIRLGQVWLGRESILGVSQFANPHPLALGKTVNPQQLQNYHPYLIAQKMISKYKDYYQL